MQTVVTVVIPTAASVSGDILMRAFGDAVSKHLGQPIIVDNKPGAGGGIGMGYVPADLAKPNTAIEIDVRGRSLAATVESKPLYVKETST